MKSRKKKMPSYSEFIAKCDWMGAIAMLDFEKSL